MRLYLLSNLRLSACCFVLNGCYGLDEEMTVVAPHGPTPDSQYLAQLQDVAFQPVFIMGDHRSGTTLLYQLLNATGYFNVVTAYSIIRYDALLANHLTGKTEQAQQQLAQEFKALGLHDRLIDGVAVSPDLPEEYGFRLHKAGPRPKLQPNNLASFIELCKKVQFVSHPDRPLLLKNPWDFLNFLYVKEQLPQAKFIFLHRHPLALINSQVNATRSVFARKNPYIALIHGWYARLFAQPLQLALTRWLFQSKLGVRITNRHVLRATNYFLKHVGALPTADYVSITYEDLCQDPQTTLTTILRFLTMQGEVSPSVVAMVKPRQLTVAPEIERQYPALAHRLHAYMTYVGYSR